MFAVVQVGSTQFTIQEKQEFLVDLMDAEEGKNVMLEKVLLYSDDTKGGVQIGTPYLPNVKVEVRVMGNEKGEKIRIFKKKPKKRFQKSQGYRSQYTRVKVLKISVLSGKAAPAAEAKEDKPVTAKPAAAKKATPVKKVAAKKEA